MFCFVGMGSYFSLALTIGLYFVINNYTLIYKFSLPCPDLFRDIPLSDYWGDWRGKKCLLCM